MTDLFTFLSDQTIQALGWTFIHSLWQGGVIAILLAIILYRLPAKHSKLRYRVSFAALAGILLSAVLTYYVILPDGNNPGIMATTGVVVVETGDGFIFWVSVIRDFLSGHLPTIVSLWLIGVVLLAIRLAGGFIYVDRLKMESTPLGTRWQEMLDAMLQKTKSSRPVRVAESALVNIPVALGMLKPVILFPVASVNRLSQKEVEAILAHELAHIARNDYLHNIIQSVIEVIFYYNPAVWWISAVVRHERENCCDDMAVQLCGSSLTYAKSLLSLEDLSGTVPALVLPAITKEKRLLNRIRRILDQPQTKSNLMEKMIATCILLLSITLFSISATKPVENSSVIQPERQRSVVLQNVTNGVESFITVVLDTVPEKNIDRVRITRSNDEGEVELVIEHNEIQSLKIDGEEIPESEFEKYASLIESLQNEVPPPPPPPLPPGLPGKPEAPPAPDVPGSVSPPEAPESPMPPDPQLEKDLQREREIIRRHKEIRSRSPRSGSGNGQGNAKGKSKSYGWIRDDDGDKRIFWVSPKGNKEIYIELDKNKLKSNSAFHFSGDTVIMLSDSVLIYDLKDLPEGLGEYKFNFDYDFMLSPDNFLVKVPEFNVEKMEWPELDEQRLKELEKQHFLYMNKHNNELKEVEELLNSKELKMDLAVEHNLLERQQEVQEKLMEAEKRLRDSDIYNHEFFYNSSPEVEVHRDFPGVGIYNLKKRPADRILEEMDEEGLIESEGSNEILLTEKRLKINGEKMPDEVHEKYIRMYEKTTGVPVTSKTKIELKTDRDK